MYPHRNLDFQQSYSPRLEFEALFKIGGRTGEWPGEPTWPLHQFLRSKQLFKQILNPYFKKSKELQANIPALVYSHFLAFLFLLWQVTTIPNCCQTWFKSIIIYIIGVCLENWNTSRRRTPSREILRKYKTRNLRTSQSHSFSRLPTKLFKMNTTESRIEAQRSKLTALSSRVLLWIPKRQVLRQSWAKRGNWWAR